METNRPSKRTIIIRILGTVFSLALLIYLIQAQGWGEFGSALHYIPWYIFAAALAFILGSRICTTLRWFVLLRFAKTRVTFWQAFRLMFMGNFASNFLPSTVGGDMVRLAGVIPLGVESGVGAASLVLDRLIGMVGMASLSPYGFTLMAHQPVGLGVLYKLAMPGFLIGLRRVPIIGWVYEKSERFVRNLITSSIGWFRRPLSLLLALLCTFGHMLFIFLIISIFLRAMQQPVSFIAIGALWSLSYFISLLPVSMNGLGLQEVSITMLYSRYAGVSMESALALAVLMRLLFLVASLPGAFFLPDIMQPRKKFA